MGYLGESTHHVKQRKAFRASDKNNMHFAVVLVERRRDNGGRYLTPQVEWTPIPNSTQEGANPGRRGRTMHSAEYSSKNDLNDVERHTILDSHVLLKVSPRLKRTEDSAFRYGRALESCSVELTDPGEPCRLDHFQKNLFWHCTLASSSPGHRLLWVQARRHSAHNDLVRNLKTSARAKDS